jgi:hypothetical protein
LMNRISISANKIKVLSLWLFFLISLLSLKAQVSPLAPTKEPYKEIRGTSPLNKSPKTVFAEVVNGDTIPVAVLGGVFSFPKENFISESQEKNYWKLVKDVKFVYPYAKTVYFTLLETMQYLETIPDKKLRDKHLRQMERDLVKEYEPVLRKMSYNQGKILLKLIDRECNTSSYELIKAYRGNFAASFWQGVARLFRADLKTGYDPEDADYTLERIVVKIEQGQL